MRHALGITAGTTVVGYAGTFGRINGVRYLVEVAAALQADERFKFLMVGDGQEHAEVRELAARYGLLGRTILMPAQQPKEQMSAVLSAMDVAASLFLPLPEMESNSANKFFDALACGRCVAINYGGWQAQLLQENAAGLRLAQQPSLAAAQLQELAQDSSRMQACGRAARQLAVGQFSFDLLAARVEATIKAACSEPGERLRKPWRSAGGA